MRGQQRLQGRHLHSLSAESYNAVAQATLRQLKTEDRHLSFSQWANPIPKKDGNYIYGDVLYSTFDSGGANWDSEGFSAMLGFDTKLDSRLTFGFNLTLSQLSTDIEGNNHASADATSALLGTRVLYRPTDSGFYLQGSLRAGVQEADLDRTVNIDTYRSSMDSDWPSFIGSVQATLGFDWQFLEDKLNLRTGPFAGANYALLHTPNITESGEVALNVERNTYESLPLEMGWRLQFEKEVGEDSSLELTADIAYFYDVMDDEDRTDASFKEAPAQVFYSELERDGRSGAYLNLGAKLKLSNGFGTGLSLGAVTGSEIEGFNLSANLTYRF